MWKLKRYKQRIQKRKERGTWKRKQYNTQVAELLRALVNIIYTQRLSYFECLSVVFALPLATGALVNFINGWCLCFELGDEVLWCFALDLQLDMLGSATGVGAAGGGLLGHMLTGDDEEKKESTIRTGTPLREKSKSQQRADEDEGEKQRTKGSKGSRAGHVAAGVGAGVVGTLAVHTRLFLYAVYGKPVLKSHFAPIWVPSQLHSFCAAW